METLRHYGKNAASREDWARVIREERAEFKAAALTGKPVSGPHDVSYGQLPEPYASQLRHSRPDYVVYSYATPIAWHDSDTGKWHVPDVNYSLTTTGHQHTVRMAVDTWDPDAGWLHDYDSDGPYVNTRTGKGKSPYGPREGW